MSTTQHTPSFLGSVMKAIACTPNRNFDEAAYERGVLAPSRRIRKMWEEKGDARPSDDEIREVLKMLVGILETKQVDPAERRERLEEIRAKHALGSLVADLMPSG